MKRDKVINLRVTAEEKAAIAANAGSVGVAAYLRQLGLKKVSPRTPVPPTPPSESDSEGLDAGPVVERRRAAPTPIDPMPKQTWGGRVRQLCMQGLPKMAAERIADQEFRGR